MVKDLLLMPLTIWQIHIGAILIDGFLLSTPVSSNPTGSIRFPGLMHSFTPTAGAALVTYTPLDPRDPPPAAPLPPEIGDATSEIKGMSIFWIIMPLFLACMIHPIGSACGFRAVYRHQVRIGPLMSLFDTLHLLYEIHSCYRSTPGGDNIIRRIRPAIHEVVVIRLHQRSGSEKDDPSNSEGAPPTAPLPSRSEKTTHNTRARHLLFILLILQYVKLCGFYGIPISFSLATIYFVSWIIMEMILLVGEGCAAMDLSGADPPTADSSSPIISGSYGLLVFILQLVTTIIGATIFVVARFDFCESIVESPERPPLLSLHCAIHLGFWVSPLYWVGHMLFLYYFSHRTVGQVLWHCTWGITFGIQCIFIVVFYPFFIPSTPLSWIVELGASYLNYLMFFYASRLPWPGGEGEEGKPLTPGRFGQGLVSSSWAFTYAGELLLFYVFLFHPEGTWKAGWTEYLP
ncbi:unnamed protein product [Tuber aestivum]|uniref:Uncharacterized protein n=1 Tax=Tuber aestivum TaxID=59557 RepID=A0A292PUG3_9PEZI|nr:unnamed protein product [Tuber aestivum]